MVHGSSGGEIVLPPATPASSPTRCSLPRPAQPAASSSSLTQNKWPPVPPSGGRQPLAHRLSRLPTTPRSILQVYDYEVGKGKYNGVVCVRVVALQSGVLAGFGGREEGSPRDLRRQESVQCSIGVQEEG
jgi:hypothetical protein